tara:strand:- start:5487 stop:6272 length:786 start_codon:yes stop_codon:yes gene_type:complete
MTIKAIRKGASKNPMRMAIYGPSAIGKTTMVCEMPDPMILTLEEGLITQTDQNIWNTEPIESFPEFIEYLEEIRDNDDYKSRKTLAIDSLDWLETLVEKYVAEKDGKESIVDFEWGTGYSKAKETLTQVFDLLDQIRDKRKMRVVFICHVKEDRKEKPGLKDYQKYELKLRTGFGEKVKEYLDMVLFYNYKYGEVKTQDDKGSLKTKVTQSKERYFFTEDCISHFAKNRYNLPPEIQVEKGKVWKTLEQELKKALSGDKND